MAFVTTEGQAVQRPESLVWQPFRQTRMIKKPVSDTLVAVRTEFDLTKDDSSSTYTYYPKKIANNQSVYLNGQLIGKSTDANGTINPYTLDHSLLKKGANTLIIVGGPFMRKTPWEELNEDPGVIGERRPAAQWKRKAFNGLAQVILLTENTPGKVIVKVTAAGLKPAEIEVGNR